MPESLHSLTIINNPTREIDLKYHMQKDYFRIIKNCNTFGKRYTEIPKKS